MLIVKDSFANPVFSRLLTFLVILRLIEALPCLKNMIIGLFSRFVFAYKLLGVPNGLLVVADSLLAIANKLSGIPDSLSAIANSVPGMPNTLSAIANKLLGNPHTPSGIANRLSAMADALLAIPDKQLYW